jgi:elongation factor Ts
VTGAGMMDCKTALTESEGDLDKAKDWLRSKGLADVRKRSARKASEGQIHAYIHPGGKVGVLVDVSCETDFVAKNELFQELIHDIALHISFANPDYISRDDVPEEVVAKEREFVEKQARDEGKPDNIVPKIVEGRMNAFYKDRCLLDQVFIRDDKTTIGDLVSTAAAKLGENIQVRRFSRFEVGK